MKISQNINMIMELKTTLFLKVTLLIWSLISKIGVKKESLKVLKWRLKIQSLFPQTYPWPDKLQEFHKV
jgi:hypothetical protein